MLTQAHIEGTSFYARIIVSGMTFPKDYGLRKEVNVNTVTGKRILPIIMVRNPGSFNSHRITPTSSH